MKHIIILFHLLVSPLILSSQVSIRSYINPDTLSTDLFSINHEKGKVLIPIHPGDFTIHSYSLLEMLEDELKMLEQSLREAIPGIKVDPFQGDYFKALGQISTAPEKDVVFLKTVFMS